MNVGTNDPLTLTETFYWRGHAIRWTSVGNGPPVVLCHGTPWSSYVWRTTVNALSKDWTVFVWDMLGYGQSDKPDAEVSIAAQSLLLADLIASWQLDPVHIVAHDFGGAVALRSHLLHGIGVRSFTLVDVVVLRPWGSPFFQLVAANADVFSALAPNLHEALLREYVCGASAKGLSKEVLDNIVKPWKGEGQVAFYRQIAQADEAHTAEIEAILNKVTVPTAVIWGADDAWIPLEQADRLVHMIPGSTSTTIPDAGHLVQEDQPEVLNARISASLLQARDSDAKPMNPTA